MPRAGIRAERKSVYGDISCLQEFGMDIVLQKGPGGGYFLASRPFELAELKLLAGAVQASKFLSERKSVALIEKLSTLCSSYQAAQLERQVTVRDRVKSMNESIYYTVDRIHEQSRKTNRFASAILTGAWTGANTSARASISPVPTRWSGTTKTIT